MQENLLKKKCNHCEKERAVLLDADAISMYMTQVVGWALAGDATSISKQFLFTNFIKAMSFVSIVADIAEEEGHHPNITIEYNKVTLTLFTHSVGALTENDFIVAAKIDDRAVLAQLL